MAGGADHDPRQRRWAVYECDCCGYIHDLEVKNNILSDYANPRICPKCKAMGVDDHKNNLLSKKQILYTKKSEIEMEIMKIEREINNLEAVSS